MQRKEPFPMTVADKCRILSSWKNRYGNKDSRVTQDNDGMTFRTINEDEKKGNREKSNMLEIQKGGTLL